MSNLTGPRKTARIHSSANIPLLYTPTPPVENATTLHAGGLVGVNAAGNLIPASTAGCVRVLGICDREVALTTVAGVVPGLCVEVGTWALDVDSAFAAGSVDTLCYLVDDHTVSLSDAGGTRLPVGVFKGSLPNGQATVAVGYFTTAPAAALGGSSAFKVRAVALVGDLAAYTGTGTGVLTGSANGAIHTADGLTLAVGDVVLYPTGVTNLTAADAGPWQVTTLGTAGTKYVLTRPSWWEHGSTIIQGQAIAVGGEGATFGLTEWRSNVQSTAKVVGTDDPAFYPKQVTFSLALVAGTVTLALCPIRSATKTGVAITRTTPNTSTATTGGYQTTTFTPGALGTASLVIQAAVAAGTINNADVSTLAVTITN